MIDNSSHKKPQHINQKLPIEIRLLMAVMMSLIGTGMIALALFAMQMVGNDLTSDGYAITIHSGTTLLITFLSGWLLRPIVEKVIISRLKLPATTDDGSVAEAPDDLSIKDYAAAGETGRNTSAILRLDGLLTSTITQLERTQTSLQESEERFRTLTRIINDCVIILDTENRITFWNPATERILGYSVAELRDQQLRNIIVADDHQAVDNHIARGEVCLSDGSREVRIIRSDGTLLSMELTIATMEYQNSSTGICLIRDITDCKAANETMHMLSWAVDQSSESIVITDTQARIEYVNEAFVRQTGYKREEVLGRNPRVLHSGKTPPNTYEALWTALRHGEVWTGEFHNRRKDGTEYVEKASITPIRDTDGSIRHYIAVKKDVIEKKMMFDQLEQHRLHLEELVIQRTQELEKAKSNAEAANSAKSTFLASMSHEIRTPMNAIVGMSYALRRTPLAPAQLDKLDKIASAANHLLKVINDILDLSRIEAHKLVLSPLDFKFSWLLEHISDMVIERVQTKGLELVIDLDPGLVSAYGDATRLGQALLNLLGNAVKFTDQGVIVLRAYPVSETEDNIYVRFEVEDSGIGIDAAHLSRLFQPFEQAENSMARRYGGSGLGLSIARRLAALMGGETGVSSTPGLGSTFWMTSRLGKSRQQNSHGAIRTFEGMSALVVDDLSIARTVHCSLLRAMGINAIPASPGAEALGALARIEAQGSATEFVLMDLKMSGMDGFETIKRIRALPLKWQPIVLLVTASGDPEIVDDARQVGFADVLPKPLSARTLCASLSKVIVVGRPQDSFESAEIFESPAGDIEIRNQYPGARILLAEDDVLNQEVTLALLSESGLIIDIAHDGKQAVEMAGATAYDLILMDVLMPNMNGLDATRAIRKQLGGKYIPILAMTASVFEDDKSLCFTAGMNDFIPKPVNPELLYSTLLHWLGKSQPVMEARDSSTPVASSDPDYCPC